MPYMVPSKLNTPVGVVLSPSRLSPLKPLAPIFAVIAGRAGCHTPPVFAYARRPAVLVDALAACTMTTWVVLAGSVRSRDASFAAAVVPAAVAFFEAETDTDGDPDAAGGDADAVDGDADGDDSAG